MTLTDYLFDSSVDTSQSSKSSVGTKASGMFNEPPTMESFVIGGMHGGTLDPLLHYGDLRNVLSIGTASNILTADIVKESAPYYREYDSDNVLTILPTWHFITGLRRQLSGDIAEGTSTFSPRENTLYTKYQEWQLGGTEEGEVLQALEALDGWFIDELTNTTHEQLNREYGNNHKWNKIFKREAI